MKILKLNATGLSLYADSSLHDKKEDLQIKIEGVPTYNALFYFVGFCNTKQVIHQRITAQSCTVTVSGEELSAGKFGCRIEQWTADKTSQQKIFRCEELGICDGDEYTEDPSVAAMRRKLESVETRLDGLEEQIKDNTAKLKELETALSAKADSAELAKVKAFANALYDFAKEAVKEVPYLNDYKFSEDLNNED